MANQYWKINKDTLWVTLIFIVTWGYFKSIFYFNITADFEAHIEFIIATSKSKTPPINFLYYLTVYLFALGNTSLVALIFGRKLFLNELCQPPASYSRITLLCLRRRFLRILRAQNPKTPKPQNPKRSRF